MQGSLASIIWTICYMSVLIGLSAYGIHRYVIIYLFLKHRKRGAVPMGHFDELPKVTMQLPIFNEVYVVERLLKSVSEIDVLPVKSWIGEKLSNSSCSPSSRNHW